MRLGSVLLLIFLVLKLTSLITWSWLWVLSPIWIPLVLIAFLFLIGGILLGEKGINAVRDGVKQGLKR
jgi:hypothetical protein